jgi:hypothetical protein
MALLSTTGESQALNSLDATAAGTNLLLWVSLHTATTGTTGAAEVSGGSYARQTSTWSASSAGSAKTNSTALTFTTSLSPTVTNLGSFSLVTAGTFGIGAALGASVTAPSVTVASGAFSLTAT